MRNIFAAVGVLLTAVLLPRALPAAEVSDDEILSAINKGADYLLSHKNGTDNWEEGPKSDFGDQTGGVTSLVLYALLQCGESSENPRIMRTSPDLAPVIKWVSNTKPAATYAASYQLMALAPLYKSKPEVRVAANRARDYLRDAISADGAFSYHGPRDRSVKPEADAFVGPNWWDNSNSQLAVLAMWYAEDYQIEVPERFWKAVDRHWRGHQDKSGGWCYHDTPPIGDPRWTEISPAMSSAGLATLYITSDRLNNDAPLVPVVDHNIETGLAWLTANYKPSVPQNNLYYLYALERVGLTGGMKFFGTTPWFATSAAELLRSQHPDGSWVTDMGGNSPAVNTAFAMLFLARGRNPIMFNKLQYAGPKPGVVSRWNARPFDAAHITHWMYREFERPLNWQTVNLKVPVEEWLDAPILLITGSQDPMFTKDDIAKIRAYVNAGGLIFSTADGKSDEFTKAMRKYAAAICDDKYEMRELPNEHPLFSIIPTHKLRNTTILGLSNGARELWIHCPTDMGAAWAMKWYSKTAAWDLPANMCMYATGKSGFRKKLRSLQVPESNTPVKHSISLALLDFSGNAEPEPAAWPRLARLARRDYATELKLSMVKIGDLDVTKTPVAHLTGTGNLTFTDEQKAKIKAFLDNGGTLFVDAAGGNAPFAQSVAHSLVTLYPSIPMDFIPVGDDLYNGKIPDSLPLAEISYRPYYLIAQGRQTMPKLQAMNFGSRHAVIFSEEDVTSGLLGTNTWGILGYSPETSETLARNILLYAANNSPGAATAPAATAPAATVPSATTAPAATQP